MRKGSKLPMTGRLSLRKGGHPNNYTRHPWNIGHPRINYDNPEHPTRKQEVKLPRAEIKQRRRKGGTPSTSPRALNNKHKHYN